MTQIVADSTSAGFLAPKAGSTVLDDDDLLDALQPIIAGVAGYTDGSLVRPRWQSKDVPNQPDYDINWIGFGIANTRSDTFHYEGHVDSGAGYDVFEYTEELDVLISCYGPKSQSFARRLSDGLKIEQNRADLNAMNMSVMSVGSPVTLPALLHSTWVRRVDVTVTLRRYISRQYGIATVIEPTKGPGQFGLNNEQYVTPITQAGG